MMKNKTIINLVLSSLYQIVVVASGIIIPKLILSSFGSEVNGLVSSVTQFLNYIYIVEGGLGGVVLANLYKPLVDNDNEKLSRVIKASNSFFRIIAIIFAIYAIGVSIIYPLLIKSSFDYFYIFSLSLILSINLFTQYCFSISYKLLLQADQKIYVVHIVNIITSIINIALSVVVVYVFPRIHILKLITAVLFIVQPIVYHIYIKKNYNLSNIKIDRKQELPERWSCFGHNVAFFINTNTDITFLTIIKGLLLVSVYSVHIMITSGIKNFINAFSQVFSPKIGTAIASENSEMVENEINTYEYFSYFISTIFFGCCACLISPFISVYTSNLPDTDIYYQPIFAVLLVLAEFLLCVRNPYEAVVYGAKQFKKMSIAAFIEAGINITISLILVWQLGLIGVAIGTCSAMLFRYIWYIIFLKKNVVKRSLKKPAKRLLASLAIMTSVYLLFTYVIKIEITNYFMWFVSGLLCFAILFAVTTSIFLLIDFKTSKMLFVSFLSRFKRNKQTINDKQG